MYIFQISDLHFQAEDERSANNLDKVVKSIAAQDVKPDLLLITGDITHGQKYDSYPQVFEKIKSLGVPFLCITGNNDSSSGLMKALQEFVPAHPHSEMADYLQYGVDTYPCRIIALDSFAPGNLSGAMDDKRLAWFEEKLNNNPSHKPTLVMIHQFTLPNTLHRGFLPWFAEFNHLIAGHQQDIRLVVSGHLHASLGGLICKTRFISAPSTNWNSIFDFNNHGNQIRDNSAPVGYLIHHFDGNDFISYHVALA